VDSSITVHAGLAGLQEIAALESADTVLVSIVGNAALLPTLSAIRAGKRIALASKEVTRDLRRADYERGCGI